MMGKYLPSGQRSRAFLTSLGGLVLGSIVLWFSSGPLLSLSSPEFSSTLSQTLMSDLDGNRTAVSMTTPDESAYNPFEANVERLTPVPTTHARMTSWGMTQAERRHLVASTCAAASLSGGSHVLSRAERRNLVVDFKHRVLYCAVPKAACSSWKAALANLTGRLPGAPQKLPFNIHDPRFLASLGLPSLAMVADERRVADILANFTKFLVVRHPLERLVSAYRDKFRTYNRWTKVFQRNYGARIAHLYRNSSDVRGSQKYLGRDVTFPEFLRFITDHRIADEERTNAHWDTYQHLCHPCHVTYDHVIKFDTFGSDTSHVLKRYFSVENPSEFFPKRNSKSIPSREMTSQFYAYIPSDLMVKLYNTFRTDFMMFGYDAFPLHRI